ncbi:AAA15 family ATPase/GTPase [Parabacteroides sp. PF5-5]|uniref:AAA family ATPase n=1 Tax=unclassified Parabacteroides TaxID=2649774 RepID=UPI00247322A0|nr:MULTISPECIES: AAA family ATPase [unclassified Parabacteroides]MDH6305732.1 AAA15 family ATPase/GTPase [Parabacteroides sp. PH5-39]MDH6316804.1 AAA15 family ATPase/GTPase [Parabacteroides sp. PF5-13]MDH6320445.1 AAA15 family ATPase/GTPase [Parabacteroides sp. PH5-13]MDH6324175.1 AAA15 family ATPase/GTPase [Parabacteroides sp. PH5-8]MDH6327990.1 AAA15 family ATPase/GTPase [Parabacteroides sp. PH5-41]
MGFQSIEINNFRGIKHLEIDNLKRINVLMGSNNVGKSSILEALFLLTGISNPYLSFKVNQYRGFPYDYFKALDVLFFERNHELPITISGKDCQGNKRMMKISPVYGFLDVDKYSNESFSSKEDEQIIGLLSAFNIGDKEYNSSFRGEHTDKGIEISQIHPEGYKENILAKLFKTDTSSEDFVTSLKSIIENKKIDSVISVLKLIEPTLNDVIIMDNSVMVDVGYSKYIPINVLGDGFRKILSLVIFIYEYRNGVLLVDEIDNGLHYSVLELLWETLFKSANEFDTQIIATTHSLDVISSLEKYLSNDERGLYRDDFRAFSIRKYDYEMKAFKYNYENIQFALEQEIEIR